MIFMKCPNGHDDSDNVKYCPTCGAEIISWNKFCTKCVTPFDVEPSINHIVFNEGKNIFFKKYLPHILGAIAFVAICSGGWWYFNSSKTPKSNNEAAVGEAIITDNIAQSQGEDISTETQSTTNQFVGKVYKGSGTGEGMEIAMMPGRVVRMILEWFEDHRKEIAWCLTSCVLVEGNIF